MYMHIFWNQILHINHTLSWVSGLIKRHTDFPPKPWGLRSFAHDILMSITAKLQYSILKISVPHSCANVCNMHVTSSFTVWMA